MTDITGISQAFAAEFGLAAVFWGYVLGSITIVAVVVALAWAVDDSPMVIIIGAAVALTLVVAIGWIDWWVVVFIFTIIIFVMVFGKNGFSFGGQAGGGA